MDGYMDCYIAYLDILGFKTMIGNEKSFENIMRIYKIIENTFKSTVKELNNDNILQYNNTKYIKWKVMSDSICLYIDAGKYPDALEVLFTYCLLLQINLISLDKPVLVRGAIVKGKIYHDNDILFGEGMVRAYQMEENNAKTPRIIITKDVLDNGNLRQDAWRVLERDIDGFYCPAYIDYLYFYKSKKPDRIQRIESLVDKQLGVTTDNSIREKYLYLENKLKQALEKYN